MPAIVHATLTGVCNRCAGARQLPGYCAAHLFRWPSLVCTTRKDPAFKALVQRLPLDNLNALLHGALPLSCVY
eukprot:2187965-Amphidinium_carterae.1